MLAEDAERPEQVGRRAQSRTGEARMRESSVGAEWLGELVKRAIVAVEKPWWTT